jgi:hypothetical protein
VCIAFVVCWDSLTDSGAFRSKNLAHLITRATAAEGVLTTNLTNEVTRATAAEDVLTTNLANEVTRATAAEDVLTNNLTSEVTNRTNADASIRTDFSDADTIMRADFAAAGNSISNEFRNADVDLGKRIDSEASARASADRNLQNDIDTNTRGIAMVAAMTNTTIQAGMTNAMDFNMATFEGEAGFGFGYARKINENLQIHTAVASTTDFEEAVARLGVSYQW